MSLTTQGLQIIKNYIDQSGGGGNSSDKDWIKILDIEITESDTARYTANNLNSLTEIYIECGKLKNDADIASGMCLAINDQSVTAQDIVIQNKNANTSTNGQYRWIYLEMVGDGKWLEAMGPTATTPTTVGGMGGSFKYTLISAGKATKVDVCQPVPQYRANQGFVKVWGR